MGFCDLPKNKKKLECSVQKPLRPIIPYFGGKTKVAKKIVAKMPPHHTFIEPMVGGGSVYWANNKANKFVINDKNKEVYNLYKTAKNSPEKINFCKIKQSKSHFDKIKSKPKKSACDTITLYKTSFGALGKSYIKKNKRYTTKLTKEHNQKLSKTKVLNQDYKIIVKKYDKKGIVQYWDPPYFEQGKVYKTSQVNPEEICKIAKSIKNAKIILSYDNNKEVKKYCRGRKLKLNILTVPYSAYGGANKGKKELLITNF